MSNRVLHLVYAADGRFAMPLAVSLFSVVRRLQPDQGTRVFIVDGGFTMTQRRRVERVAHRGAGQRCLQVEWVKPRSEWWQNVKPDFSGKHLNETVLYRLGITDFLPLNVTRALYLDADVFAKCDVAELLDQVDDDCALVAATDLVMSTWERRFFSKRRPLERLGLKGDEPYFNAGVLAINVEYWRQHGVSGRTATFLNDYIDIASFYDQDALNFELRGVWKDAGPRWNFFPTCRDTMSRRGLSVERVFKTTFEELQRGAKLVHFTGAKPWDQGFTNPERPFFLEELKQSQWFTAAGFLAWKVGWYGKLLRRGIEKYVRRRLISRRRREGGSEDMTSAGAAT